MPQTMTAAARRRWQELLGGLVPLIPEEATAVLDGPPGGDGTWTDAADRIIAALTAAGLTWAPGPASGAGRADGQRAGEVVIWLRTIPLSRGTADDGAAAADIVIDAQDQDWPVIRRVAAPLAGRGPWYLAETRAFFACRAAGWDAKFGDDIPAYAAAVAEAGLAAGGTAIDVGCGTGRAVPALREAVGPSGTVVAIDLTPEMLEQARPRCNAARAARVLADARRLPLGDGSADAIFAAGLVTHLPDPAAGFAELARVTRPGGRLVLFHPSGRAAPPAGNARREHRPSLLQHEPAPPSTECHLRSSRPGSLVYELVSNQGGKSRITGKRVTLGIPG
jgi:SAM-dependent methyltransferase